MLIIDALKTFNKDDLKDIKGPIMMLLFFFIIGIILFPKPCKIYKNYILKQCSCVGLKAAPKQTKGSLLADEYCLGIPIKCTSQKIFMPVQKIQGRVKTN